MHRDHGMFLLAVKRRRKVLLTVLEDAEGKTSTSICGPILYVPARKGEDSARYYFYRPEHPAGSQIVGLMLEEIISIEPTQEPFDPSCFTLVTGGHTALEDKYPHITSGPTE